ncbi:hypothetical protein [Geomicrobium sp. JCM 19039]|uniref:hypothetical protein n=1 Tax=Geomicrobium sp. JCM 19039 TaxID=1460636 RepID=UPI00045F4D84|nr:hypothetical protein [Geomicrobium sp. JCM 19039]GAK10449.1 hypothetical protein JCM19039_61 [Geomicrobium sp. JCM 19039]
MKVRWVVIGILVLIIGITVFLLFPRTTTFGEELHETITAEQFTSVSMYELHDTDPITVQIEGSENVTRFLQPSSSMEMVQGSAPPINVSYSLTIVSYDTGHTYSLLVSETGISIENKNYEIVSENTLFQSIHDELDEAE